MSGSGSNFNNNTPSGDIGSWIAIVICFAFGLWPIGILLLIRKINTKSKNVNNGAHRQSTSERWQQPPGFSQQRASNAQGYSKSGQTVQQPNQAGSAAPRQSYQNASANLQFRQAWKQNAQSPDNRAAQRKKSTDKKQNPAKNLAIALTLLSILLGIIGVIFLSSGLSALAISGIAAGSMAMTIFGGFSLLGAAITALTRGSVLRRMHRFTKYAAVIGDRDVVSVSEISRAVGEPVRKTHKWLQAMLDSGYYGEHAYIDSGLESFVKSRAAAEKARGATESADKTDKEKQASAENQYVAIVNELHMLCSQTSDPAICAKIERIESLTVKIFKIVEENPEKAPQIRRFMNYYLPTTLKLLHSYQTLERQDVAGENITSAKNDIERILDTLASGFEQQLDNLFKADKLDISADIDVIENLMEQDGLTGEGIMRTSGGN